MSDAAKAEAQDLFDFVARCYPDALIGLNIPDSPTVRRTYFYGVMKTVFGYDEMDQYVKMHLLNMLRNEIGLSAEDLASEILKYIAEDK
jgi:hypothetical protein